MTATPTRPTAAELQAETERDAARAAELMEADPKLPFISAFIIASNMRQAERSLDWLREGKADWDRAELMCGSYGRLDLRVRALAEGLITPRQAYADLPEAWSGSDPDDTDPRFLSLWKAAWKDNGQRFLRDKPGTKLGGVMVTVFRGQDEGAPFGIAWSLDVNVARKFANGAATRQHHRGGVVYKAMVPRAKVLGYNVGRSEAEIVLDPADLVDITLV